MNQIFASFCVGSVDEAPQPGRRYGRLGYTQADTDLRRHPESSKSCDQPMAGLIADLKDRDLHVTILWMCGLDHRQLKQNGVGFAESCIVATEMLA